MKTLKIALFSALFGSMLAQGATIPQAQFFRIQESGDFKRGKFEGTSLREGGSLGLVPGSRLMEDITAPVTWTVVDLGDLLVVGTGHRGTLLLYPKGASNGLPVILPASEVLSVAEGPGGFLYVGTAPKGVIFKVKRDGSQFEIFAMMGETYIWDLLRDGKDLIAATGNPGRLYRIPFEKPEPQLLHSSAEDNILKVRMLKGAIHFSTSGKGLLQRLDGEKAKTIYDAGGRDINDFDGAGESILLATSGKKMIPETGGGTGGEIRSFFQNEVVEIDARGRHRTVFTARNQVFPALKIRDGRELLLGTADEGEIHQIDIKTGRSTLIHRLPGASINAFSKGTSNTYFVTGNDTGFYQLDLVYPRRGTWTSDVYDTRGVSQWGRVNLAGQHLNGVSVSTRTGNSYAPGKDWSAWAAVDASGKILGENARFIQVRLELTSTSNQSPEVSDIRLSYGIEPRLPVFTSFQVGRNNDIEKNFKINMDSGDLLLWWDVSDDRPELVEYRLSLRSLKNNEFKDLDLKLRQRNWVLRRAQLPDGEWQFKISAYDRTDAGPALEPRDQMVSRRIAVDNTPPVVTGIKQAGNKLYFHVSDSTSLVQKVEASARLEDFKSLAPVDGLCDGPDEDFVYEIPAKAAFVILKVNDDAGNEGTVTVDTQP